MSVSGSVVSTGGGGGASSAIDAGAYTPAIRAIDSTQAVAKCFCNEMFPPSHVGEQNWPQLRRT